ncbi:MAG: MBL fold metallo-hydrolase [Sodaliphilus sp.]|nr:MBL fold metallo-hydrolase [Sodaliphilus sp.]
MNKNNYIRHNNRQLSIDFDTDDDPQAPVPTAAKQPVPATDEHRDLHFVSFGSGSSGNCAYLGTNKEGILIDAGVDLNHVFDDLRKNSIKPEMVKGIILTHDHADHIRYSYQIVRKYKHIRIYCTPRLMNGLLRHHNISRRIKEYQEPIYIETPFKLAGLQITAFETSHDGTDNMGFFIESGDKKFVVATDMGIITARAEHYMQQANYLMIESNYCRVMLDEGRYPEYLKNRVRGEKGHLDNVVAAQFVKEHYHPGLEYVFLCHLSNDNNTPDIALRTMTDALESINLTVGDASNAVDQRDKDVQLYALPRYDTSLWFVL